jgi:hypothetical protein
MVGPWQPPFIMDEAAYKAKLAELEAAVKASGKTLDHYETQLLYWQAREHAYATEFSVICTAAIRGDWEPAHTRCRTEREEHGEGAAAELMNTYRSAVERKLELMKEVDAAARDNRRRR